VAGVARSVRQRVAALVADGGVLCRGERALLLLSGGADSMALLDLARRADRRLGLGLTFVALHVDYRTRGASSTRDRRIVEEACGAAGVELRVVELERRPPKPGFQDAARRIRYDAAEALVARGAADVIVTAHNRDDQAETVVYRLAKYASPGALRAMRPREGLLARPLLCLGAEEIRAYCAECGIVYGVDESNAGTDYARNLIRHQVMPVLARVNPRAGETIADLAATAAAEHDVLEAAVTDAWDRAAREAPDGEEGLDLGALAAEPEALRTLCVRRLLARALGREALVERRLTALVGRLAAGTAGSQAVAVGRGFEAVREYDTLWVRRRAGGHASCPPVRLRPGAGVEFCGRRFRADIIPGATWERAGDEAWLDAAAAPEGLTLRHPRRGDRQRPLGMTQPVLLSDLLTAAKVPRARRPAAVVAEAGGRVAWVLPGRVSEEFKVTAATMATLHVYEEEQ
jgi:tRNA(Ile)-lysidine synthase